MTGARRPHGEGIEVGDADPTGVWFRTDGPFAFATQEDLDRARFRIRRFGFDYVYRNAIDESDLTELANAILKAQERQRLESSPDYCRKCGAETPRADRLCDRCHGAAEDLSIQLRSTR